MQGFHFLGRSQVVRQRVLIPSCVGSNPSAPTNLTGVYMISYSKLVFLVVCLLFCTNLRADDSGLCTTAFIDQVVKSKYEDGSQVASLWTDLKTKNTVRIKDLDSNIRPKMVTIQYLIESALAALLSNGDIKYARAVIYTPLPPTPLRADNDNLNVLVGKDFYEDKDRMQTILDRITSVKQYLGSGGMLYSVYNDTKSAKHNVPGLDTYTTNISTYGKALIDNPVQKIQTRATGASYIAECKDGTKMFFSIKGNQVNNTKSKTWSLSYGSLANKKLNNYFKKAQELYKKSAGIAFDFQ